jgi:hypothetical protein
MTSRADKSKNAQHLLLAKTLTDLEMGHQRLIVNYNLDSAMMSIPQDIHAEV